MDSKKNNVTWVIIAAIVVVLGGLYIFRDNLGLEKNLVKSAQTAQSASSKDSKEKLQAAPDITIKFTDGKEEKLSDLKGKTVLLNFWAVDCAPCRAEIPNIEAVYKKDNKDVEIIGIASDRANAKDTLDVLHNQGGNYPIMVDEGNKAFSAYGVRATPTTVVINSKGEVVGGHTGYASEEQLSELIAKAQA